MNNLFDYPLDAEIIPFGIYLDGMVYGVVWDEADGPGVGIAMVLLDGRAAIEQGDDDLTIFGIAAPVYNQDVAVMDAHVCHRIASYRDERRGVVELEQGTEVLFLLLIAQAGDRTARLDRDVAVGDRHRLVQDDGDELAVVVRAREGFRLLIHHGQLAGRLPIPVRR